VCALGWCLTEGAAIMALLPVALALGILMAAYAAKGR